MKGFVSAIVSVVLMLAFVLASAAPASAGNCGNFGGQSFGGFNSFGFHSQNVGGFGFHGQNFHGQNFNNPRIRGNNGAFSLGGRAPVFVGFDRFGNPVFR